MPTKDIFIVFSSNLEEVKLTEEIRGLQAIYLKAFSIDGILGATPYFRLSFPHGTKTHPHHLANNNALLTKYPLLINSSGTSYQETYVTPRPVASGSRASFDRFFVGLDNPNGGFDSAIIHLILEYGDASIKPDQSQY